MNPHATRPLGRTRLELPLIGFGAAPIGELFTRVDEETAHATLARAWQEGVRFYDTAPWYGRGQSEHRVGRFLYRQPRDEVLLSTKVGRVLSAPAPETARKFDTGFWAGGLHFEHRFDYTRAGILRAHEDSLQRLGMNRVDMLVIHDLDLWHHGTPEAVQEGLRQLDEGGGFRALAELKAEGRIGAIGVGINELGSIPTFVRHFDIDFFLLALRYTLGEHDALEDELPMCVRAGIGIVIGGVYSSGLYASGPVAGAKYNYRDPTEAELLRAARIAACCQRHGITLAAAALQFPLMHPAVVSVIPGAIRPEQVSANLALARETIPSDLWRELKHEGLIRSDAPTD